MITMRGKHKAFHPDGAQIIHDIDNDVFAMTRVAPDQSQGMHVIINVTDKDITIPWQGRELALPAYGIEYIALKEKELSAFKNAA
jgi:hypothetical protein